MAVRMVIIGYGMGMNQRLNHCEVIQRTPGLILYGICELQAAHREEARRCYDVRIYATVEEVLTDDRVDGVVIATPNESHFSIAFQCLEAGKHVIVEKPMCLTVEEADVLIEASRRHQRILTVRHNRRWDGDYLTVKRIVEQAMLGKVLVLDTALNTFIKPSDWRALKHTGGGQFIDWGCHLIDQVLQLIPSRPVSVFAVMDSHIWNVEVDTYTRVLLRFEDGTISEIETSNVSWIPRPRWYVLGERGSLVYMNGRFYLRTTLEEREIQPIQGNDWEFYMNFSEAVHQGEELIVKPEEARAVIALMEAAIRSAQTGQVIWL